MLFYRQLRLTLYAFLAALAVYAARPALACAKEGLLGGVGIGGGTRAFTSPDATLRQYRIALMPELRLDDIVTVGPLLSMTQSDIRLYHGPRLPLDASLTLPWQPSLGARFETEVFRCAWFRVLLSGEFESALSRTHARVNRMEPYDELSDAITDIQDLLRTGRGLGAQFGVTVPNLDGLVPHALTSGIGLSTRWDVMQTEVTLGARWAFLEPTLGLGVLRLRQASRVEVLPELRQLLDEYDISLRTRYVTDTMVPLIAPGLRMDLFGGTELRLRAVWLSAKEFSFSTVDGAIFIPLDL